jgi:spoIIIJ-associated protein
MDPTPKEILDDLLGHLGFSVTIEETGSTEVPVLQVHTPEAVRLVGHEGQTLEDLQFLLNRLLLAKNPDAPRVTVDVEHHRAMKEDHLMQRVRAAADQVRQTGRPVQLEPLNSYDRRLVHQAFKEDNEIISVSPNDDSRLKRITLQRRG